MQREFNKILVFDFETGGFSTDKNGIVQVGCVAFDRTGKELGAYSQIVNNDLHIEPSAERVHGISKQACKTQGVPLDVAIKKMLSWYDRADCHVTFNGLAFDMRFLRAEAARCNLTVHEDPEMHIDMFRIMKLIIDPKILKRSLQACCVEYGVPLEKAHDATADARATGHLMFEVMARHSLTLEQLASRNIPLPDSRFGMDPMYALFCGASSVKNY